MCFVVRNMQGEDPVNDDVLARAARLRAAAAASPRQAATILALADRLETAAALTAASAHGDPAWAAESSPAGAGLGRSKKSSGRRSTDSAAAKSSTGW